MEKENKYCQLKIAVVGADSSGKTTLCYDLAKEIKAVVVDEYARIFLDKNGLEYHEDDLLTIAKGHLNLEEESRAFHSMVLSDTNVMSIVVWSYIKYGRCNDELLALARKSKYDLILLTDFNIPWNYDPMRENPDINERKIIHDLFLKLLNNEGLVYHVISGNRKERVNISKKFMNEFIESSP